MHFFLFSHHRWSRTLSFTHTSHLLHSHPTSQISFIILPRRCYSFAAAHCQCPFDLHYPCTARDVRAALLTFTQLLSSAFTYLSSLTFTTHDPSAHLSLYLIYLPHSIPCSMKILGFGR
ncbi:uncharacterized protein SCHCODRAFT_01238579 [Schizophyllum commune H4-8]|uniref:uncharacterized protein n=1 Tax=Schizophyllum commune (strain H4-8 / FGSC 9210) TaxID=578458 RepID=UPI00215DF457|nr:uncharacterized protein SCHCODRAFT_01238579 [Schizophyllum commune H4-8]KAI5887460.1 hypothetical protein SCHCODRAFT_01238579 [Schizophyllum commune H4-8]